MQILKEGANKADNEQYKDAIVDFNLIIRDAKSSQLHLTLAYLGRGAARNFLEKYSLAKRDIQHSLQITKYIPFFQSLGLLALADINIALNKTEEAYSNYDEIIDNNRSSKENIITAHSFKLAHQNLEHTHDKNIQFYTNIIKSKSITPEKITAAYMNRSDIYTEKNNHNAANKDLTIIINTTKIPAPIKLKAHLKRGNSYKILKEYNKVLKDYTIIIKHKNKKNSSPMNTTKNEATKLKTYLKRASLYKQLKRYDDAIADYQSIIDTEDVKDKHTEKAQFLLEAVKKLKNKPTP